MIGNRLRELRTSKHLTQQQVADKIGLTRPAYTAYETEKRVPDGPMTAKLATIYGVSTDYILGRTNDKLTLSDKDNKNRKKVVDIDDNDVIMSFEGKPIPPEDLEIMKRFLRGGKDEQ